MRAANPVTSGYSRSPTHSQMESVDPFTGVWCATRRTFIDQHLCPCTYVLVCSTENDNRKSSLQSISADCRLYHPCRLAFRYPPHRTPREDPFCPTSRIVRFYLIPVYAGVLPVNTLPRRLAGFLKKGVEPDDSLRQLFTFFDK